MECKTSQVIQLQSASGEACQSWLVLGEVVGVHIAESAIQDGVYDTAAMQPVMRGGGPGDYFSVSELQKFQLFRPK
jgi:flavin reductase (DIM6/NTAB) family NADH-FMN oxidoreductase RutF